MQACVLFFVQTCDALLCCICARSQTSMQVYGGFLRDYVVRGEEHDEMDLDVAAPPGMQPVHEIASRRTINMVMLALSP